MGGWVWVWREGGLIVSCLYISTVSRVCLGERVDVFGVESVD